MIVAENLDEFKVWYKKQMDKRVVAFAEQAMQEYYNTVLNPPGSPGIDDEDDLFNMNFDTSSSGNTQADMAQTAFRRVDQLNEIIFNSSMKQIKQMMTISIMETQVLLDRIDVNSKNLEFINKNPQFIQ